MNGKIIAGALVISGVVAGIAMYWLQVYAFYEPVVFTPGQEIRLTTLAGMPEVIAAENVTGIDADSSPLRFRACFTTMLPQATLAATYQVYDHADPLTAPRWFDCFDANRIGAALETGEAIAFLSQSDIHPDVDRVVAMFPDGHGYVWHQLNAKADD